MGDKRVRTSYFCLKCLLYRTEAFHGARVTVFLGITVIYCIYVLCIYVYVASVIKPIMIIMIIVKVSRPR